MKKFAFPALAALALAACADSTPEETTVDADTTITEPMAADTGMADPMATDTGAATDPMATDPMATDPAATATPEPTATPM